MDPSPIPFNRPYLTGREMLLMQEAVSGGRMAGNGPFTERCHRLLGEATGAGKVLLTTSCTSALHMAALLLDLRPGDEVIMPSYTFVSTANPFVMMGAKAVLTDSRADRPGMDEEAIGALITPRTRAIVVMHYAGVACDMDRVMELADRHGLMVVEDAAQAIGATYRGRPLGSIGHLGAISFHETKNVHCGEGGALLINSTELEAGAEAIWEHGTDRAAFMRGEVDSYHWKQVGASFTPSEMLAAFLSAQLDCVDDVTTRRVALWETYSEGLKHVFSQGRLLPPAVPEHAAHNGHIFHVVCRDRADRDGLIAHLRDRGIRAAFHYQALHTSPFFAPQHDGRELPNCQRYSDCLVRLPLFIGITAQQQQAVIDAVISYSWA